MKLIKRYNCKFANCLLQLKVTELNSIQLMNLSNVWNGMLKVNFGLRILDFIALVILLSLTFMRL